jgi:hypothetical protein
MQRLLVPILWVRVNPKKLRKLHPKKVARYEREFERGDEFPPIEVENCGGFYTIRDGRHRYIAQLNLGYQMIDVVVVRGGGALVVDRSGLARLCHTHPAFCLFMLD